MAHTEFVQWSNDLDTGIETIDLQHRRLVDYLNQLLSTDGKDDREAVTLVLDGLLEYTERHFAFEIELLEAAGYELVAGHRRAHDLFIRHLQSYIQRFKSGEDITADLALMLRQWLLRHIKVEDGDYKATVRQHLRQTKGNNGWLRGLLQRVFG